MNTEPKTAQNIVDAQLAELQITSAEVTGATYKEQHDAKIAALAAEEAELPTPTDKASLQVVQDFITKSEKARTGIDKWRKAFKDQWKKIIDPVDAYIGTNKENGMQARLYEIQQRAEAKKKAYLDEQAKAQREAEQLLEQRYQDRFNKLIGAGMVVDATGNLTIRDGDLTLSALPSQIRFATDEQMAAVMVKVDVIRTAQIEREEAARQAKEAEEREAQELKDRLAKQQEEQEAQAAKLKAEREAFEKEKAEMRGTKNRLREQELVTLGAEVVEDGVFGRGVGLGGPTYVCEDLADMDEARWTEVKQQVREAKVKAIKEQQQRDREWELYVVREQELINMGIPYDGDNTWTLGSETVKDSVLFKATSDEWAAVLARFKEAAEARDNQSAEDPDQWKKDGRLTNPNPGPVTATLVEIPATVDAIRERVGGAFNEPHNEEEYREDVAKANAIIEQVSGDQQTIAKLLIPEGSAVAGDQSDHDIELIRAVFVSAEHLQVAIAKCCGDLRSKDNEAFMTNIYFVHQENVLTALAHAIGSEVKNVHELKIPV